MRCRDDQVYLLHHPVCLQTRTPIPASVDGPFKLRVDLVQLMFIRWTMGEGAWIWLFGHINLVLSLAVNLRRLWSVVLCQPALRDCTYEEIA